jgi:ADP-ribose pyrophosphatase YjhB (NUDIX family)
MLTEGANLRRIPTYRAHDQCRCAILAATRQTSFGLFRLDRSGRACNGSRRNADARSKLNFCSDCGQRIVSERLAGSERPQFVCRACKKVHYRSPAVLVSCIAYHGNRILVCRRALEPFRGLWTIPAGFMEENETIEQAAVRETAEETGVIIEPERLELYAVLSLPRMNEVYLTLRTELTSAPALVPGTEALDVAMIGENDIAAEDWAFSSPMVTRNTAVLFRELRSGHFGIHKMQAFSNLPDDYEIRTYVTAATWPEVERGEGALKDP